MHNIYFVLLPPSLQSNVLFMKGFPLGFEIIYLKVTALFFNFAL